MPKPILFLSLLLVLPILGCGNESQHAPSSSIGLYDISNDDQHILFSFVNGDRSSIYEIKTDGSELKQIIPSKNDTDYYNPKYSKNGKKILFIASPQKKSGKNAIYVSYIDGTKKEKIVDDAGIITEAFFSDCEDKIYFCKANSYGHYSPIARNAPHDFDIYSVDITSKKNDRVTQLKAYGIFGVSEYDCQHILMFMPMQDKGGMISIPKDDPTNITRINPVNNPRQNLTMYYTPLYSKPYNTLGFIATYELMIMNMEDKMARTVADRAGKSQFGNFVFFNTKKRIVFTTVDENNFNMINFDRSDSTSISIPIKNPSH